MIVAAATANNCDYKCNSNGGCTVKYVGPPRAGKVSGSCFPESFGGSCSGTPRECQNCNTVLNCQEGGSSLGNQGSQWSQGFDNAGSGNQGSQWSQGNNNAGSGNQGSQLCNYECKSDGGCSAEYIGPFRPGTKSGSCFPQSFGGRCTGIPPECGNSCHPYCQNGSQGNQVSNAGGSSQGSGYEEQSLGNQGSQDSSFCCSTVQVSVDSDTSLSVYKDIYNIYDDVNGKPVWLSSSSIFAIWFIPSYESWVIGTKDLISVYDNAADARSIKDPPPYSGRSENVAQCPEEINFIYWLNISANAWALGKYCIHLESFFYFFDK